MGLKWDSEARRHDRADAGYRSHGDPDGAHYDDQGAAGGGQYQAPTLTMLLEIGLRTAASHTAWNGLKTLTQSAMWVAAGAFLRPERIQRSPLTQKLAALAKSLG